MMSPPVAADDVSPLTPRTETSSIRRGPRGAEMMLFAIAHNDEMFAPMCPQAHIIAAGSIMCDPFPTNRYSRFAGDPKGSAHHLPDRANIIEKSSLTAAFFWRSRADSNRRPSA